MVKKTSLILQEKIAGSRMEKKYNPDLQADLKRAKNIDDFLSFMDKYFEKMKQVDTRSNLLKSMFL